MRLTHILFIIAAAAFAVPSNAGDLQQPVPHIWILDACSQWNTAASAMVLANGDPYVMVIPVDSLQHPWLILRRVPGGVVSPDDAPFIMETFDSMADGSARFAAIDSSHIPRLITTIDGKTLVIYSRDVPARRRVTRQ